MSTLLGPVRAAIISGPHHLEVVEVDATSLPEGWGSIRVEVCGLCGTDAEQFEGSFTGSRWPAGPIIPGHEIIGTIEHLPAGLARRGFQIGDRIAIEPTIPCGSCRYCLTGRYVSCDGWSPLPFAYGFIPMSYGPGLWGGYAERMALHPNTVVHRVPAGLSAGTASLFNAVGTAWEWTVRVPQLEPGERVLVMGAGQRGLAAVVSALAAGASEVMVTGVNSDVQRLQHARDLGAVAAINVQVDSVVEAVADWTRGAGVDLVVDTSAGATQPVSDAVRCVADGGRVVLGGLKAGGRAELDVDSVVLRAVRLIGVRSAGWQSYRSALDLLARDPRLGELRSHVFSLDKASEAVRVLRDADESRVYVSIEPHAS